MDFQEYVLIKWDNTTNVGRMLWVGMFLMTMGIFVAANIYGSLGLAGLGGWLFHEVLTGPVGHNKDKG